MDVDERLGRLLRLLQGSIRAAGHTQTEVDGRIGRRRGYLSHVFQRRVDLKLIDLLRALQVLQVDPARFFRAAFAARSDERAPVDDLMQLVSELRVGWPETARSLPAEEAARDDDRELLERVREAVRTILDERTNGPVAVAAGSWRRRGG
jgi:hypothetical protein